MKTRDVITHYGSAYRVAKALGLQPTIVYRWGEEPPPLRQFQIAYATKNLFAVNPIHLPPGVPTASKPDPRVTRIAPARLKKNPATRARAKPATRTTSTPKNRASSKGVSMLELRRASLEDF